VLNVHAAIKTIRGSEYAALRSQILRAAMSIPANLVEGVGQKSAKEFARFIRISLNSANELEYHLQLAKDFNVLESGEFKILLEQTVRVRKMLHGLLRSIVSRAPSTGPTSSHRGSRATANGATGNPERVPSEPE
jgi:four helix bundle protein